MGVPIGPDLINVFPTELLAEIFKALRSRKADLASVSRVCWRWNVTSLPILYRSMEAGDFYRDPEILIQGLNNATFRYGSSTCLRFLETNVTDNGFPYRFPETQICSN